MTKSFWLDEEYHDAYGEWVRRGLPEFDDSWGDIAPVLFACTAWWMAIPPRMTPGYVRWHRRVVSAECYRNTWDGTLTARAELVSPLPAELTCSREWWHDRGWREWPQTFGQFLEPSDHDLARAPHVRTLLLVEAPLPIDELPPAPPGPGDGVVDTARRAVRVLTRELNDLLTPIIDRLEG
ncbi:hypothetical protein DPM19_29825 [Actinomadura craniellae]|uniref:Uncharacterized protein n=1 Tax=Actinomadura craniellae TaxID=2231787 RepID=A0A365GXG4_9ACTN|nr:hypothetical protein [Actinomadura craniellae]RAY11506.1 hypothetical protein DPM19_29825 [Actinomadura craniellae]